MNENIEEPQKLNAAAIDALLGADACLTLGLIQDDFNNADFYAKSQQREDYRNNMPTVLAYLQKALVAAGCAEKA